MGRELRYEINLTTRIIHWVLFTSITVNVFTGFYIHTPFIAGGPGGFLMAWMRFFHFVASYALVLALIVKVYLAFNSRFDKTWKDYGIIKNLKDLPDILGYYLFLKSTHKDYRKYNPLQAFAYLSIALLLIFSALTGAAIYKGRLFGIINSAEGFRWVSTMLGGESYTRIWHYLSMWGFIIFAGVHIYMVVLHTLVNRDKTLTSMFSGYRLRKKTS